MDCGESNDHVEGIVKHFPRNGSMKLTMEQAYNWVGRELTGCSVVSIHTCT